MITKLKWQWQSSNNDTAHARSNSTRTSTPNPQRGRVITGMLTGGHTDLFQSPPRSTGGSNGNSGFGF